MNKSPLHIAFGGEFSLVGFGRHPPDGQEAESRGVWTKFGVVRLGTETETGDLDLVFREDHGLPSLEAP